MAKLKIGLVYGGKSGEHEVSVRSAESIRTNLDKDKYEVVDIFIPKNDQWDQGQFENIDVFFPIIHGTYGEDGCLQGLFELMDVAYVGAGVLGSAIGMDKDVMKRLLSQAGIAVTPWITFRSNYSEAEIDAASKQLGWPIFVKPANLGSSVGVSRATNPQELIQSMTTAFEYDTKIILEQTIMGREIECSVLGNEHVEVSLPGEIKVTQGFYDYKTKYLDDRPVELIIPAVLEDKLLKSVQDTAVKVYKCLECRGMGRVDMFLTQDNQVVVNEINTLPGFTSISMYPKLWEVSGLSYSKLLDTLIQLALEEKRVRLQLRRSYD